MATSPPRDRLLYAVRAVDVLACVGLFAVALLCRLPLVPHYEISSDTMDPLIHGWRMLEGTTGWFSAHNPLYGYGRAWTHVPLLLLSDGLLGVARNVAILGSLVPVSVYIAGRIVTGGHEPGPQGLPVRRAGALLGPLVGAALLARFPGLLDEQLGTNVYRTVDLGAALMIPFAVFLRAAGLGGPDGGDPTPQRRVLRTAAVAMGILLAMMALNHPYGAAAAGGLVPLLILMVWRGRRDAVGPLAVFVGVALLCSLPHLIFLIRESSQMGEGLIGYARSDAEFGAMDWAMTWDRLLAERGSSALGAWVTRSPFIAVLGGAVALYWRPRLAGAALLTGVSGLTALGTAAVMSKLSQHIQPYHWRPLLPLLALGAGLVVTLALDLGLRRSPRERARDLERARGRARVVLERVPLAVIGFALVSSGVSAVRAGFHADEGFYRGLWSDGIVRQAVHHHRIRQRILAHRARTGVLPVFAGLDFPPFELVIDQLAVTLDLRLAGVDGAEMRGSWREAADRDVLLHVGQMGRVPSGLMDALRSPIDVLDGGPGFLLLQGSPAALRRWTRRLCPPDHAPAWLVRPDAGQDYRLHGDLEVRHLVLEGELHAEAYPWAHPCLEPFAWPGLDGGEFPFTDQPHDPFAPIDVNAYRWVELPPTHISRIETPRRAWDSCVVAGACTAIAWPDPQDQWLPATGVAAEDAATFCRWLVPSAEREGRIWIGGLPSELQWETAATWRNGVSQARSRWPWGDAPEFARANLQGTGPAPVGSWPRGASPNEVEDMVGNVAEWVVGAVRPGEDGRAGDLRADEFLLAGGSWRTAGPQLEGAMFTAPAARHPQDDVGFRCVLQGQDAP